MNARLSSAKRNVAARALLGALLAGAFTTAYPACGAAFGDAIGAQIKVKSGG